MYAAAIFAYPASLSQGALGSTVGAALLYLVNLVRVVSLIGIGRYFPGRFQVAHPYLCHALFLATRTSIGGEHTHHSDTDTKSLCDSCPTHRGGGSANALSRPIAVTPRLFVP